MFAGYTAQPQQQHPLQRCLAVVDHVLQHQDAFPFAEPVDPNKVEGCDNYYEVIKDPMDLGTIRARLLSSMGGGWAPGQYSTPEEVWNDLQLIWSNCRTFNGADSSISMMAGACERDVYEQWLHQGLGDAHTLPRPVSGIQRRGSGRCSVCTKAKRGSCGTDNAVRGCLFRPGGPIPSLPRSNSSKSALAAAAAQGHLPPRPTASRASTKAPLSRAALGSGSLKAPPAKRTRVRRRFMSASTAAAAAALHQWHGRDPAELQAILDAPAPVAPPLVAAGPPPAPPEPDQATLEEERRVLRTYRQVVARRAAFPKLEAEMHAKLEAQAQAQRRLDAIIAQQAARAAARVPHADAVHAPLDNEATVEQPAVGTMRADVAALGAFLFGQLAGAPGAMRSPC